VAVDSHHFDDEQDLDPDPHCSEKLDPDPHSSKYCSRIHRSLTGGSTLA
jgi:hypothetical protein